MNAVDRRMEIISILVVSDHITARELAQEKLKKCMIRRKGKIKNLRMGFPKIWGL